ncbi:MAG: hypothetical protein LBC05_01725 [Endomicrobium sp.]|jgi:hypothetical protein|nr:hypothetical protein [Endomicrobium sp.]
MKDKNLFKLLMEETGCNQDEAKLALSTSNNNFEKAISTITSLFKFINLFKIKLAFNNENVYGLIQMVVNTKNSEISLFSLVFSRNPATYEISINIDWVSFEKIIFSVRLDEVTMEDYTKKIEENLKLYAQQAIKNIPEVSMNKIISIIKTFFYPYVVKMEIVNEELNLLQFKKLLNYNVKQDKNLSIKHNLGFIKLDVQIVSDINGKSAEKIIEGDILLSIIVDKRDIAHYLAHLIGGKKNNNIIPLAAKVKNIYFNNNEFAIYFQYTPSIMGFTKIGIDTKVKILENDNGKVWWGKTAL